MVNLEAFGHFFAFTATAGFAATLYKELQPILFSIITNFNVEDLYEEKKICEENHKVFMELKNMSENPMSESEKYKSNKTKLNLEGQKVVLDQAELDVKYFLNDVHSDPYKDSFDKKIKPLFSLAGTYSVIVILIAAFSHAYHSQHNLSINVLIFFNFCMTAICIINIWKLPKTVPVNIRNAYLNLFLIISAIVATLLSLLIVYKEWYWFALGVWTEGFILAWSLLLSGISAIAILWKCLRVNGIAKRLIKNFKNANVKYAKASKELIANL